MLAVSLQFSDGSELYCPTF